MDEADDGSSDSGLPGAFSSITRRWDDVRDKRAAAGAWLVRNWLLLAVGGLVGLVVSGPLAAASVRYSVEGLVAPAPQLTVTTLEPSITTNANAARGVSLRPQRLQALADLAANARVEAEAINKLKKSLPDVAFQAGDLVGRVHASVKPRSELISISIDAESPSEATLVANAWVSSYVDFINTLYVASSGPSLETLRAERDRAAGQRDAAQIALEANLKQSNVEALTNTVERLEQELDVLEATPVRFSTSDSDYRSMKVRTLNDLAQTMRRVDDAERSAQLILSGIGDQPNLNSSDESAIALLKAQLVTIGSSPSSNLQLSINTSSDITTTRADLQVLVASLAQVHAQLADQVTSQRQQYESEIAASAPQIDSELRNLRAQLEVAKADRLSLTSARDLAQATYDALANKVEEQRIQAATAGREVEAVGLAGVKPDFQMMLAIRGLGVVLGVISSAALIVALRGVYRRRPETPRLGTARVG